MVLVWMFEMGSFERLWLLCLATLRFGGEIKKCIFSQEGWMSRYWDRFQLRYAKTRKESQIHHCNEVPFQGRGKETLMTISRWHQFVMETKMSFCLSFKIACKAQGEEEEHQFDWSVRKKKSVQLFSIEKMRVWQNSLSGFIRTWIHPVLTQLTLICRWSA